MTRPAYPFSFACSTCSTSLNDLPAPCMRGQVNLLFDVERPAIGDVKQLLGAPFVPPATLPIE